MLFHVMFQSCVTLFHLCHEKRFFNSDSPQNASFVLNREMQSDVNAKMFILWNQTLICARCPSLWKVHYDYQVILNSKRRHSINTFTLTHEQVLHGLHSLSGANVEKNNPCRVRMIKLVFSGKKVESNIISKQLLLNSHHTESYYFTPDAQPFSSRSIIQQQYSKSI